MGILPSQILILILSNDILKNFKSVTFINNLQKTFSVIFNISKIFLFVKQIGSKKADYHANLY